MALPSKKIRLVIPDPETRDEVTHQFDTWEQVAEFVKEKLEAPKNVPTRIEVKEAD